MHLIWNCNFAQDCWHSLLRGKKRGTSVYEELMQTAEQLLRKFSTKIAILGCWNIWIQINGRVFRAQQPTHQAWRYFLQKDLNSLQFKIKENHVPAFKQ